MVGTILSKDQESLSSLADAELGAPQRPSRTSSAARRRSPPTAACWAPPVASATLLNRRG